jgi:hypothetical protein
MSGSRWTEERAGEWLQGSAIVDLTDHQVYYLKCLGSVPGNRWLDGRTADGTVGLAPLTTWPFTGTRWRAHKQTDGSWAFRCLGDAPGNKWLDGRTADGTVGLAPNPWFPFTGTRWQVFSAASGQQHVLKCLGQITGNSFLDGDTAAATTRLVSQTGFPNTGTLWELRPERWWVGCNFIPSTAVNQLEMWQHDTFDPVTIARELGWARDLGFNAVRVFLHDLLATDWPAFRDRIHAYLDLAAARNIGTLFVFFDDVWFDNPHLGPQPAPVADTHNSRWVQSPGDAVVALPSLFGRLQTYVTTVLQEFRDDHRVIGWDLYNEPGGGFGKNCPRAVPSLNLLRAVFAWAREVNPTQPLTSAVWADAVGFNPWVWSPECTELRQFQLDHSDVISFHRYADPIKPQSVANEIDQLKTLGRPVMCTEYMARRENSRFENHLAHFNETGVGCFNWGLVGGKTQTFLPWGFTPRCEWFHDILRPWGTPYSAPEVAIVKCLAGRETAGAGLQANAIYQFKCLGDFEPPQGVWLDGRTAVAEVGLAPDKGSLPSGTNWRAVKLMEGVFAFRCLGDIEGDRWLDGRTLDGTVGLAPGVDDAHSGVQWQPCRVDGAVYVFRCLGDAEGPRLLDGRTADATVGLTPHTETTITGIQWLAIKISDG